MSVFVCYYPNIVSFQKSVDVVGRYSDILLFVNDGLEYNINQKYVYVSDENVGTAGAYNYAIDLCLKEGYDYLWLWDQDSFVNNVNCELYIDDAIKIMNSDKSIAGVGFKDKNNIPVGVYRNNYRFVRYLKSSGTLYRVSDLIECGLFDEILFLDYVDWDMCYKIKNNNKYVIESDLIALDKHDLGTVYNTVFGKKNAPSPFRLGVQRKNVFKLIKRKYIPFVDRIYLVLRINIWFFYGLIFKDRYDRIKNLLFYK